MGKAVGIDLGTTYSAVAWVDANGRTAIVKNSEDKPITPSVIQFFDDGRMLFGNEAKEAAEFGESGCVQTFKRGMGEPGAYCTFYDKSYTAQDLSALLLRHLKEEAEARLGDRITDAVVTVPAYFRDAERKATQEAARAAGLNLLCLVDEPVAAAMNYGLMHWRDNAVIMVYDLGGGTFDVTLVKMENRTLEVMRTQGNHKLGGKDWDNRLVDIICEHYRADYQEDISKDNAARTAIAQAVEGCKRKLTVASAVDVTVMLPDSGSYTTRVTREEFDRYTIDLLDKTGMLCRKVLEEANLTWQDVTDVLLVGGSTRMPQVEAYLQNLSGRKPLRNVNPDESVALGAALRADVLMREGGEIAYMPVRQTRAANADGDNGGEVVMKPRGPVGQEQSGEMIITRPVTRLAHALGIVAVNEEGTAYLNQTIIPTNSQVPSSTARKFHFYTQASQDNELEIYVLEGGGKLFSAECQFVAKYVVTGIRHEGRAPAEIRIQYSKDPSSITHVQARQGNDTVDLPIRVEPLDDVSRFMRPPEKIEQRAELTIVMAIDVSGSMSGNPLKDAKTAMREFVHRYEGTGTRIGVMIVSDDSKWMIDPTDDYRACIRAIDKIECNYGQIGYGNRADPFEKILKALSGVEGDCYGIVLADGVWSYQNKAIERARNCHRAGIKIIGLGFGSADKKFMRDISNAGEVMTDTSAGLSASFGKIAQTIGTGSSGKQGKNGDEGVADTWEVR